MTKQITYVSINGISVIKDGCSAFYKVYNHAATMDVARNESGDLLDPGTEIYKYFKNREKQLTRYYGSEFCPKHSLFASAFCGCKE